jgi:hypothetical protein
MLGDLDIEVIKVEALDDDPMRMMGTGTVRDGEGRKTDAATERPNLLVDPRCADRWLRTDPRSR